MAGACVYNGLTRSLGVGDEAAIILLTPEESASPRELGPAGERRREIALTVELALQRLPTETDTEFFDRLDSFAAQVEDVIDEDPTLGGVAASAILETSSFDGIDTEQSTLLAVMTLRYGVMTTGDAGSLPSGRLSIVKAGDLFIGRLRDWSLEAAGDPSDVGHSGSAWEEVSEKFRPRWTATLFMTLDDSDAAQAALEIKSSHDFVFWPRGEGVGQGRAGRGVVSAIDEAVADDGDVIRTVTITGSGPLGPVPAA